MPKLLSNINWRTFFWDTVYITLAMALQFWILDIEYTFFTSRVDYGNIILVGAPKSITNKLQRVLNAAVTGTGKYDRGLSYLLLTELHWLDIPERVLYKLALMVHRCLQDKVPQYLLNYCVPVVCNCDLPLVISFY